MSKMASHVPFGHLQYKLWTKEGSGVKLAIWFPTTKSRESIRPWCMQVDCNTPLESSSGELQVFFRPHPNQRFEQRVMNSQSSRSPNRDSFGTFPWKSWEKVSFRCSAAGKCKENYMREGGGFPRVQAVLSHVSPGSPKACPNTANAPKCELTNLLVGLMQVQVTK
jgi:hypothetical protein